MGTQYIGTARQGAVQSVAYTATAGTTANGATKGVVKVRILTTTDAWILISQGGTPATSSNGTYLPAKAAEYFTVQGGDKISAVQDTAAGTLNVTECD